MVRAAYPTKRNQGDAHTQRESVLDSSVTEDDYVLYV